MDLGPEPLLDPGLLPDHVVLQPGQPPAGQGQFAGDDCRPMLTVLEQDGDVVGVDPVGLTLADALGDLPSGLQGVQDGHIIAVIDEEVAEAVPVVAGGFHGDGHLGRPAHLFQSIEDALITLGIVGERLRADNPVAVAIDDAGHVLVLAHVDAAESGLLSWRCHAE